MEQMFKQPYLDGETDIGGSIPNEPIQAESEGTSESTTQPIINTPPQVEKIKVKYNHEEMEIPYEEAIVHIQKGMNYDKAIEKTRQEFDSTIADLFGEYDIKTFDAYIKAIKEQREEDKRREEIDRLITTNNIPTEIAERLLNNENKLKNLEAEKEAITKEKAEQLKREKEWAEFQAEYPDKKPDDIPKDVFEDIATNGRTLLDAYARYEVKVLKDQLAQLKKIEENKGSSTGNVQGNGQVAEEYISQDVFEAKKGDRNWVVKNLEKITKSRAKW